MPVFADVIPEPPIYPINGYSPTSVYTPDLGIMLAKIRWSAFLIIFLLLLAYWIVCLRRIFNKAWLPWRWSLIPVYREYLRFKMVWRNGRWTASLLCPIMFWVILIMSYFKTAEKFGKDKEQFWLWLRRLHPVFLWILAFDKSKYQK